MSKFVPIDGRPVTPYEREILTILQEEAAEVIVAASKLLRFGVGNTNPTTGEANTRELALEVGDLRAMVSTIVSAGLIDGLFINEGHNRKIDRLRTFLQNAPEERR